VIRRYINKRDFKGAKVSGHGIDNGLFMERGILHIVSLGSIQSNLQQYIYMTSK
jgi:hypothetical protein